MGLSVIILAAGQGSRMNSRKPKVLQQLAGKSLLRHVFNTVHKVADNIIIVKGHLGSQLQEDLDDMSITWVEQESLLGTGHAVMQALPYIPNNHKVLILYGDVPLIKQQTLSHFIEKTTDQDLGILTAHVKNPSGLGRIIRNEYGEISAIIEEKDANDLQRQVCEINTGIYCVHVRHLKNWLPKVSNKKCSK